MNTLWQDLRYGVRMLARSPGFAVLVIGTLAVGIAANTSLFSVVNAVILRPLPYKDSDRLVTIREDGYDWKKGFAYRPNFFYLQEHNTVFESLAGARWLWGGAPTSRRSLRRRGCRARGCPESNRS